MSKHEHFVAFDLFVDALEPAYVFFSFYSIHCKDFQQRCHEKYVNCFTLIFFTIQYAAAATNSNGQ